MPVRLPKQLPSNSQQHTHNVVLTESSVVRRRLFVYVDVTNAYSNDQSRVHRRMRMRLSAGARALSKSRVDSCRTQRRELPRDDDWLFGAGRGVHFR